MGLSTLSRVARRTAALVVVALILAACGPETANQFAGADAKYETSLSIHLTDDAPVAVRDIEIDIDRGNIEGSTETEVFLYAPARGVQVTLLADSHSPASSYSAQGSVHVRMVLDGCEPSSCSRTVHLVAERLDPGLKDVVIDATLMLATVPSEPGQSLASDAMTVRVTDPGPAGVHRAVVEDETSGVEVLDPDHPLLELELSALLGPGALRDPSSMVADAWVVVEGLDGASLTDVVIGRTPAHNVPYGDGIGLELTWVRCDTCESGWQDGGWWPITVVLAKDAAGPVPIRWRFLPRLIDYSVDAAPADRTVEATTLSVNRGRPDRRSVSQTASGTLRITTDNSRASAGYLISPSAALTALACQGGVELVRTEILTLTAVEATGPRVRDRNLEFLLQETDAQSGVRFDADGLPYTGRRSEVIECDLNESPWVAGTAVGPTIRPAEDGFETTLAQMSPIRISWNLEVSLTILGDGDFPRDATFELVEVKADD